MVVVGSSPPGEPDPMGRLPNWQRRGNTLRLRFYPRLKRATRARPDVPAPTLTNKRRRRPRGSADT